MATSPEIIYESSLHSTRGTTVDISPRATACRLRMIDCRAFVEESILRICEFSDLPPTSYSAISYVWKGNPPDPLDPDPEKLGFLSVAGALDGDPISLGVMRYACLASTQEETNYLWLDRLCILQTSKEDKSWQISKMFTLYKRCAHCIILAGGTQRLVALDEETAWIHRAWTLQEAVAPPRTLALFAWKHGPASVIANEKLATINEVVPGRCARLHAYILFEACLKGEIAWRPASMPASMPHDHMQTIPVSIFGARTQNLAALGIVFYYELRPGKLNRLYEDDLGVAVYNALWQSALMRTSSRPVDMVFSIMGLFGVSLDPRQFSPDDREGATIALAREILKKPGGCASWMGAAVRMPLSRRLSVFPEFPKTSVAGKAEIQTSDGLEDAASFFDGEYVDLEPPHSGLPPGEMGMDNYMTLRRQAVTVVASPAEPPDIDQSKGRTCWEAMNGTFWEVLPDASLDMQIYPRTAAMWLGNFLPYEDHPAEPQHKFDYPVKLMLLKEHRPGKFHVESFFAVEYSVFVRGIDKCWNEHTFSVGGPEPIE